MELPIGQRMGQGWGIYSSTICRSQRAWRYLGKGPNAVQHEKCFSEGKGAIRGQKRRIQFPSASN